MAYSIRTVQTALVALLSENNTSTSGLNLSAGMTATTAGLLKEVIAGTPQNAPRTQQQLPCVWVGLDGDQEEWSSMGQGAERKMRPSFELVVAAYASPAEGHDAAEAASAILTDNIRTMLRNKPNMSNTVAWVRVTTVKYNADFPGTDNTYVCASRISVEAQKFST